MALACMKCKKFFRPLKTGAYVEELMPLGPPGPDQEWKSYKIWSVDIAKCPGCGAEVAWGWGLRPLSEHFQPDYQETKQKLGVKIQIDDCGGMSP